LDYSPFLYPYRIFVITKTRNGPGFHITEWFQAEIAMKRKWCCKNIHVDPYAALSLGLSQYRFSTPDIRALMRHVLSGRTIKRLKVTLDHGREVVLEP
jgi:hypothetical protein